MSRLDQHVATVRNKLTVESFLHALAWGGIGLAGVVWAAIVLDRAAQVRLPEQGMWLWGAMGAVVAGAGIWAAVKRPSEHWAAVAIDEHLGLKEKFSTALYMRPVNDPFAAAAVRDAEGTADSVSLNRRFPIQYPKQGVWIGVLAVGAFVTGQFMPTLDLFGQEAKRVKVALEQKKAEEAKQIVEKAAAVVQSMPKAVADKEQVKLAGKELAELMNGPIKDPEAARRIAAKALQDVNQAMKNEVSKSSNFATAKNEAQAFKGMAPSPDEKGPVSDAQRALAKGEFSMAVDQIGKAVEQFKAMDEKQKEQAQKQMQNLSQQLQQMSQNLNNPQKMQQQLQQMGANQQQAQQMAQAMQQAAQGNPQAQQQLKQMAQQMAQQMNNGHGATPQQQNQMNQMMQQMQAQAATGAQAQQMAQAAQNMAQGMQQCQQGQQQGNQGQQGAGQQQMAQAGAQMQQQLEQMDAVAKDAQQMAAAQQAAQQGAQDAMNGMGGQNNGQGQGNQNPGDGQWQAGDPNQQGQGGQGGPARAAGARPKGQEAPFAVKAEMSPSKIDEKGKVLAATFVKAESLKGESKAELKSVVASAVKEATDEVDQERVSRPAQKVVRDYFKAVEDDAK